MVNKYKNVERDMTFNFMASQPGGSTRVYMTDEELNGIDSKWENSDAIAVFDFGKVFTGTNGGNSKNALALKYKEANDENPSDGIDYAKFEGKARAEMGEYPVNGENFALMFPYKKFADKPCGSISLTMDFETQDGTLDKLRKEFMYAWGFTLGICEDAEVILQEAQAGCSSGLSWHGHGGDKIILDNKMSIIRFSMIAGTANVQGDTVWETLDSYLKKQKLEVSRIEIDNHAGAAVPISKADIDLNSGRVTPSEYGSSSLSVVAPGGAGLTFKEIREEEATPTTVGGTERVAWGSTFYLSVPCPSNRQLDYKPYLTIYTQSSIDHKTVQGCPVFVGSLERKTIKEGDYYMTAPIRVIDNKVQIVENAKIYLYHHSSYTWTDDESIDIY